MKNAQAEQQTEKEEKEEERIEKRTDQGARIKDWGRRRNPYRF